MNLSLKTQILNFFRQLFFLPFLEKWLVGKTQGQEFGTIYTKFIPNHYQYKGDTLRLAERNGIKYCFDLSDLVDWYMYYGFKDPSKKKLFGLIKKGDCVMDIGANVGEISFNFSHIVGDKGKVIGFEPDKFNFDRLMRNYTLNKFDNIELVNKGLGNNPGRFIMRINENEDGNNGSKRIVGSAKGAEEENSIEVIALDTYISESKLDKLSLIKMDVEGYEVNVLKSAEQTIQKFKPIIYTEMQDKKLKEFGYSANEMLNFIRAKGYTISNAEDGIPIDKDFNADDCHIDILCMPN